VKPQGTFVRADSTVHFDVETTVNLDTSLIIQPGNPKGDYAFRFNNSFKDRFLAVPGILVQNRFDTFDDFLNGLVKFSLSRIPVIHVFQYV
jgi:hypothetical protein